MGIFNKSDIDSGKSETTIISQGARIDGEFDFECILHIDGEISGKVRSQNVVVIGKSGVLKGELSAQKVVVNGIFEGELSADSLEILAGGAVNGDIAVGQVAIENGGRFNGNSKIRELENAIKPEKTEPKKHKKDEKKDQEADIFAS